jgi:putative tryptophan/tyrosine transport system substrate-binding protein
MLGLLKEVVPAARRVAVMLEAANPTMSHIFDATLAAARHAGVVLRAFELRDWKDVDTAHLDLLREPTDGLIVLPDRVTSALAWDITRLAAQLRLPAVYPSTHFVVNAGGLMSYGIDWMVQSTRMADFVARILNGEKPAAIPVEQPTRFELVVSMNVARHQGLHIPQSILLQATEVIR